jgi:hypothetical protein
LVPVQAAPFDCLGVHVPFEQKYPLMQLVSAVQAVGKQALVLAQTTLPGQGPVEAAPSTQLPAPSQAPALVLS